jgi:hypothetical protein
MWAVGRSCRFTGEKIQERFVSDYAELNLLTLCWTSNYRHSTLFVHVAVGTMCQTDFQRKRGTTSEETAANPLSPLLVYAMVFGGLCLNLSGLGRSNAQPTGGYQPTCSQYVSLGRVLSRSWSPSADSQSDQIPNLETRDSR